MARIRTIKPEFWRDDGLSMISAEASLLAIGLLNVADDEGYFNANYKLIEADIFPLRELSVSIHALVNELLNIGYIHVFSCDDGKNYGLVVNFVAHQVISRKTDSKIKGLKLIREDSMSSNGALIVGREGKGREQGKERKGKVASDDDDDLRKYSFDEFYSRYPIKKSKQDTIKAWGKLNNDNQILAVELLDKFIKGIQEGISPPHPSTYLNNKRWEDEPAIKGNGAQTVMATSHKHFEKPEPITRAKPSKSLKETLTDIRHQIGVNHG